MDVREKLVELLVEASHECDDFYDLWDMRQCAEEIASFMIAHGVTVQEWISVKDRLPEIVSAHKRYRSTYKSSDRVLAVCKQKSGKVMVKEGFVEFYNDFPEPVWRIPGSIDCVTHWMPLPQPPKGE